MVGRLQTLTSRTVLQLITMNHFNFEILHSELRYTSSCCDYSQHFMCISILFYVDFVVVAFFSCCCGGAHSQIAHLMLTIGTIKGGENIDKTCMQNFKFKEKSKTAHMIFFTTKIVYFWKCLLYVVFSIANESLDRIAFHECLVPWTKSVAALRPLLSCVFVKTLQNFTCTCFKRRYLFA